MAAKPKQLTIHTLPRIHVTHPEIGKALDQIVQYLRKNLPPMQGNRQ